MNCDKHGYFAFEFDCPRCREERAAVREYQYYELRGSLCLISALLLEGKPEEALAEATRALKGERDE